jgi:hypothetical protein
MGELSRFSWKGLFALFFRAATKGEMRLPAALIQGTSRLRFKSSGISSSGGSDDGGGGGGDGGGLLLVSHEETLDLVACVNTDRVQNRRVARHLLEFLDTRQELVTIHFWLSDWFNNIVHDCRVLISTVPTHDSVKCFDDLHHTNATNKR